MKTRSKRQTRELVAQLVAGFEMSAIRITIMVCRQEYRAERRLEERCGYSTVDIGGSE